MNKKTGGIALLAAIAVIATIVWQDHRMRPEMPGSIVAPANPAIAAETARDRRAAQALIGGTAPKQILFGDLHVHTTYSIDAFAWSLPMFGGDGVHPPAEACDYARYCSRLDFFASTEHSESLTAQHWQDIKDTVRRCNAIAGDAQNPDLVSFIGWEWTQMGLTPETHYGHKNVIFRDLGDDQVPARPIGSGGTAGRAMRSTQLNWVQEFLAPYTAWSSRHQSIDRKRKMDHLAAQPLCAEGVPVRELPANCIEAAKDPATLFAKLKDWGFDSLVIPHGNTWGYYTPAGSSWDKQLSLKQHDPARQHIVEVFSGHGNSEEYRDWQEVAFGPNGERLCPPVRKDYLPGCQRAGQIIASRCSGISKAECDARVLAAQQNYLNAQNAGRITVPNTVPEDWLDAAQCRDCYLPAFNYRPKNSTQYALALRNFEETDAAGDPLAFRFGFIASSDNHAAQPGTGYKELGRHGNTETHGQNGFLRGQFISAADHRGDGDTSVPYNPESAAFSYMQYNETERLQSYFYTGGLVAAHSQGRSRDAIWDALNRHEVYATSGGRMLLWFDLIDADGTRKPMGSVLRGTSAPKFEVRALGAFVQKPGCPADTLKALGSERVERICRGECYFPGDTRERISRIEVIRIRPQSRPGEPMKDLIEDPWRTFACSEDEGGCMVRFDDPDYPKMQREAIYYVRAVQTPTPTVNGALERCRFNAAGECTKVDICHGDGRTGTADDCLAPAAERAWSSPIFLRP